MDNKEGILMDSSAINRLRVGLGILVVANIATALVAVRAARQEEAEYEARLIAQHDAARVALGAAELEGTVDALEAQLADQREITSRVQASWERCEERAAQ
jgi:hypothetical protein